MSDAWLDEYGVGIVASALTELAPTIASPSAKGLVQVDGWDGRLIVKGGAVSLHCADDCRGAAHDVQAVLIIAAARRRVRFLEVVGSRSPVAGMTRHAMRTSQVPLTGDHILAISQLAVGLPMEPQIRLPGYAITFEVPPGAEFGRDGGPTPAEWSGVRELTERGGGPLGQPERWTLAAQLLVKGLVRVVGTEGCPLLPPPPALRSRPAPEPASSPAPFGYRSPPAGPAGYPPPAATSAGGYPPSREPAFPGWPAAPGGELPKRLPPGRHLSPEARALLRGLASREISLPGMHVSNDGGTVPPPGADDEQQRNRVPDDGVPGGGAHGGATPGSGASGRGPAGTAATDNGVPRARRNGYGERLPPAR